MTERMTERARTNYDNNWRKLRLWHLAGEPLCRRCGSLGRVTEATQVDHIIPIRDAPDRILDPTNLQSLCDNCHNSHKQREERTGNAGCDAMGNPIGRGHHWNKG